MLDLTVNWLESLTNIPDFQIALKSLKIIFWIFGQKYVKTTGFLRQERENQLYGTNLNFGGSVTTLHPNISPMITNHSSSSS